MWNGTKVTPIGEATVDVFNQKTTKTHKVKFTVVQNSLTCLLGLTTVKELGFISINTDQFIFRMSTQNDTDVTESHPTMQPSDDDKPGELGTARLYTNPGRFRGLNAADDIIVAGRGETQEEAERVHEKNLKMLKERCKDKGIKLNPNKASEKQEEVTYMGPSISAKGVQPNTSKIEAILKMLAPQDIHDVRRFCGMVQYLAKFLSNISEVLQPLRELTN
ncbi:hypothetical protein RRG08_056751 [Elysia crispata]|uniref:Reverse transcriptase domain-containing protein n=1 Tax=Elysia crispata TaxID=231223 RepID=A0AAE0ZQZ6_9GAST|nr:hypothetical protein RRG08_056751 [Elysia crispata]